MHRQKLVAAGSIVVVACSVAVGGPLQGGLASKQIDHIMLATSEKETLAAFLSETLQLPLVWPGPGGDWSYSIGISFGNVDLELMPADEPPTRITSLALQPVDLATAHEFLEAHSLGHFEPDFTGNDNGGRWAAMGLRGFGHPMFFIQFLGHDMDERRARLANVLRTRRGGPLGIERVREVRLNVEQPEAVRSLWDTLFGPAASPSETIWQIGDGPAVRLVEAARGEPEGLVVEVASLRRALAAAQSMDIVAIATEEAIELDSGRLGGLSIVLVGS